MGNPKRHHFLPEFYLYGFAKDGMVWLHDKKLEQFRHQTPTNTAVIGHYYTTLDEQGEKDYETKTKVEWPLEITIPRGLRACRVTAPYMGLRACDSMVQGDHEF